MGLHRVHRIGGDCHGSSFIVDLTHLKFDSLNLATWKRTDLPKLCPMEDHLLVTMLAPNVNQNPECRRCP